VEGRASQRGSALLLDVEHLVVDYRAGLRRRAVRAVDDVSFSIDAGQTVSIVGGPGSGKSTLGGAILGLREIASGCIRFRGQDVTHLTRARRRELGGQLQAVFQDPGSSLDPAHTIGDAVAEPLVVGAALSSDAAWHRVADIMERLGLDPGEAARYPNEFSTRQLQLVAITRALVSRPALVVCDEPMSALDPATRSRVIDVLGELQAQAGTSFLVLARDGSAPWGERGRVLTLAAGRLTQG